MESKFDIANICRTAARIGSVLVILLGIPYLIFVGAQLISGEENTPAITLYLILLLGMLAGMAVAWWREGLGAAITMASMVGVFILSGAALPGVGAGEGFLLFAGPVNLCFAVLIPGYHPDMSPIAKWVPVISLILQFGPAILFFSSWWLRDGSKRLAHSPSTNQD